jgi:hypothetical protein
MRLIFGLLLLSLAQLAEAQNTPAMEAPAELPYYQIPDYPAKFNACTVAARTLDGLGFRYYWATEGLREEDLSYRPSADARTSAETIDHIYGLVQMMRDAVLQRPNGSSGDPEPLTFADQRRQTLLAIQEVSNILKASKPRDLKKYNIVFQRGDTTSEFPFWNVLNGPLADALWHVGQVVSFRRGSGNPFNGKASVFAGKVRE